MEFFKYFDFFLFFYSFPNLPLTWCAQKKNGHVLKFFECFQFFFEGFSVFFMFFESFWIFFTFFLKTWIFLGIFLLCNAKRIIAMMSSNFHNKNQWEPILIVHPSKPFIAEYCENTPTIENITYENLKPNRTLALSISEIIHFWIGLLKPKKPVLLHLHQTLPFPIIPCSNRW